MAKATTYYEQLLGIREAILGPNNLQVANALADLGTAQLVQGNLVEARTHLERAIAIKIEAYGPSHVSVATDLVNLGALLQSQSDFTGATERYKQALTFFQNSDLSFEEGAVLFQLGRATSGLGRPVDGLRLMCLGYVSGKRANHPDAEVRGLPAIQLAAEGIGYDKEQLRTLLTEIEGDYACDRGQKLVSEAFPASPPSHQAVDL